MSLRFLFWGYTLFWIILAAYLGLLALRQHSLLRRLERLRSRVEGPAGRDQKRS